MRQQVHFTRMANNSCPILLRRVLQKKISLFAGPTNGLYFLKTSRAWWRWSCLTTDVKGYCSVTNYVFFWHLGTCNLVGRACCLHFRASPILEAVGFSETSVLINKNAPRYAVKDSNLYSYLCEDFRFLILQVMLICGYLGQCTPRWRL
jgi:hypothetical protein